MDEAQKPYDASRYQDAAVAFKHAAMAYRKNWGQLQEAALMEIGRQALEEQALLCPFIDSGSAEDPFDCYCPKVTKIG